MLKVLVADDDIVSAKMLATALGKRGYSVEVAPDGEKAWERLVTAPHPDIAILDWFMPVLTGPEIAEHYAKRDDLPFLYRIILSGKMDKANVIQALHRGAHDVLEKPYDLPLIESRLAVAARIIREKKAVEEMAKVMQRYGEQMEQLAQERAQQLVHADRMSCLGTMSAGIAHEINNPMSFISGNTQSVQRYWKDLEPVLRAELTRDGAPKAKLQFILDEVPKALDSIMNGVTRVTAIIKGLKKYSGKADKDFREGVEINSCIEQALDLCRSSFPKVMTVKKQLAPNLPAIRANPVEIEQVLVNLFVNASHAMEGRETQILSVETALAPTGLRVLVSDTGTGIPEALLNKIWDPFMTTKAVGKGTGLGLSISSGIIKGHGGVLKAMNRSEGGAIFEMVLPVRAEGTPT